MMDNITQYRSIGWDFDFVIYQNPRSAQFWDYIERNEHDQRHYIITFRTGRLFDRLWYDLDRAGSKLLPFHFRGVEGIPDHIFTAFENGKRSGMELLYWKGKMCKNLGCELLIDDAEIHVWPGCARHNIEWLHPDMVAL